MKFINNNTIQLDKKINELDKLVLDFLEILEKHTNYVIVSGYVSILLGRSRGTEDIDLFIESLSKKDFEKLFSALVKKSYWCLNYKSVDKAYEQLANNTAIRFAKSKEIMPNFKIKFVDDEWSKISIQRPVTVQINKHKIRVSPLELQIAYKLLLGSRKDIEDARHIYKLVETHLDTKKLNYFIDNLEVRKVFESKIKKEFKGSEFRW